MNDSPISRGFSGRRRADANAKHIPPGQHLTSDFPVLSAGPTPEPDFENWQFQLGDGDAELGSWDWTQFGVLTQTDITTDIHCVTSWSKLDTRWRGVTIDTLLDAVGLTEPPSPFAIISCEGGHNKLAFRGPDRRQGNNRHPFRRACRLQPVLHSHE